MQGSEPLSHQTQISMLVAIPPSTTPIVTPHAKAQGGSKVLHDVQIAPQIEWTHDRPGYLAAHPPPRLAEADEAFLTPELKMHRALTKPLDGLSQHNPAAKAARDWAIKMYILFKRVKAARDELFLAMHHRRIDPSDAATVLLHAQEDFVKLLVAELRAKLEEGRHYHTDFKGSEAILAHVGSPFYHAVSLWEAMERFLRGFENDGVPRFVEHKANTPVSAPQPPKNRHRPVVRSVSMPLSPTREVHWDDSDSSSDESIF